MKTNPKPKKPNPRDFITILNAREKNLKNISLQIPKQKLIVLTGPSGSGKTTLAFGTLYAEGKRRYIESLSSYARQFLGSTEKPAVDRIIGLTPAIAIEQKTINKNPRSTVGTITEIYDYLRVLYARAGLPHCVNGHGPITTTTISKMVSHIRNQFPTAVFLKIYAPIVQNQKGQFQTKFAKWTQEGFYQVMINQKTYSLDQEITLTKNQKHNIALLIDEFNFEHSQTDQERLTIALETAINYGHGFVHIYPNDGQKLIYAQKFSCGECGYSIPDMEPRFFSFNAVLGACQTCKGLGENLAVDEKILIPNPNLSINEGGILFYRSIIGTQSLDWQKLVGLCNHFKIDRDMPIRDLTDRERDLIFYGSKVPVKYWWINEKTGSRLSLNHVISGVITIIKRRFLNTSSRSIHSKMMKKYLIHKICENCQGKRLNADALSVYLNDLNISDLTQLSIEDLLAQIKNLNLTNEQFLIVESVINEIKNRLQFLCDVGLNYLTLSRSADTLSGGESQRIRLATQIGSQLTGVLYVLDEPSIGLHQYDNQKLIKTLRSISNLGNTVLVVEHDLETMLESDYLIDLGPLAGSYGGQLIATGTPKQIKNNPQSLTGQYLSGKKTIPIPQKRRPINDHYLKIRNANANNLINFNVDIPLNAFVCITGLSGSGKSTLLNDVIYKNLQQQLNRYNTSIPAPVDAIIHESKIKKVIYISQDPIGKTPRSNPATYTSLFTDIRNLFAETPLAKARGYKPGRFSFNVASGRCLKCNGDGQIAHSMLFLPDVYIKCDECKGKRFNAATLEIKFKQKTIADVLAMEVQTAAKLFASQINIARKLQTLIDVGLGYLVLGQSSIELSGGEAQRVKLAAHLNKRNNYDETLYIFDEPTTGLHSYDVAILLKMLNYLVDQGGSIIVIEHNLDIIKSADYLIDLGPKGGKNGGKIIACGTPEVVAQNSRSYTGKFLKQILQKNHLWK